MQSKKPKAHENKSRKPKPPFPAQHQKNPLEMSLTTKVSIYGSDTKESISA